MVFCQLLGFAALLLPTCMRAESLEDAAHELAMKVCLAPRKQAVRVQWQEPPGARGYLSASRRRVFQDQISACGLEAAENSDAPILTVTIQVTPSEALLIANAIDAASHTQIYVVEVPRASLTVARETASTPLLRRELVWQQEKPIQSALEWRDPATEERFLFLLSDGLLDRFRLENGAWKWVDSTEFLSAGARSRAPEASLLYSRAKARVELALPGKICALDLNARLSYTCTASEFGDKTRELSTTCEESPRYLATGKGDYTQPDRIALARASGTAAAVADDSYAGSMDVPGPVLDISVTEDSKTASAVVKNLSTGNYEVYRITTVCDH